MASRLTAFRLAYSRLVFALAFSVIVPTVVNSRTPGTVLDASGTAGHFYMAQIGISLLRGKPSVAKRDFTGICTLKKKDNPTGSASRGRRIEWLSE